MSYDLTIKGGSDTGSVLAAVRALPDASFFEVAACQPDVTVCINGDDATCARFAIALLAWAQQRGLVVYDPQRGREVQSQAALPWKLPPLRGKTLKTKLKNFAKLDLGSHGFELQGSRTLARTLDKLEQGLEFQPLSPGRFTVNVWWRILLGRLPGSVGFTASARIEKLGGARDYDSSSDREFEMARVHVLKCALPHLNRYATLEALLRGAEDEELSLSEAFGPSPGWHLYERAMCRAHLGRIDEAIADLELVVAEHSLSHHLQHARSMRAEGREDFALQAEAEHAKAVAAGVRTWIDDRRDAARAHADTLRTTGRLADIH